MKIHEVQTKGDLRDFVLLPHQIYQEHKIFVPPIRMDDFEFFNKDKNPYFKKCKTILLIARNHQNKTIGRIMGIIHPQYNEKHRQKHVRFSFLEYGKDKALGAQLIKSVEIWAKEHKMDFIVGPLSFSDKEPQGYLTYGYEELPVVSTYCNGPSAVELMEELGFKPHQNLVVYKTPIHSLPAVYEIITKRVKQQNPELKSLVIKNKIQLFKWIRPLFELVNLSFKEIYAFNPLELKEIKALAFKYLPVLNPKYLKALVDQDGKMIAFVLAMPNMSHGIIKSKGKMIPFGIFHVWRSQRKTKQLDLLLGAVHPKYQGKGLTAVLAQELIEEASNSGFEFMDSHLELESNKKVQRENIRLGGSVYKRYSIFKRAISAEAASKS